MKKKGKIVGFSIFIVTICALTFLASKTFTKNETLGDTGWTVDQFIEWAYKVEPVKEHKIWKIWKDGKKVTEWVYEDQPVKEYKMGNKILKPRRGKIKISKGKEKELMEPNDKILCGILNDLNDVPWNYPLYKYEWSFELPSPYEKLPEPIRKILDSVNKADVGKNVGEILSYLSKPVAICAVIKKEDKSVSSEAVEVRLLSLSDDKLEFTVETEPFILSDNPEIKGKIGDRMVLYVPIGLDCKINICKPEKRKEGYFEKQAN